MRLSVISFTANGRQLSREIAGRLRGDIRIEVCLFTKCRDNRDAKDDPPVLPAESSVGEWAGEQMRQGNALLFIGACAIAVRAIAPSLTDKLRDAPVLVMDEKGEYVIPILSGHMGGANELARLISGEMGAKPVITTATDLNQRFAVDLFAKRNGLFIVNKEGIAKVSSKVLAGREIAISIEPGHEDTGMGLREQREQGVRLTPYPPASFVDVVITSEDKEFDAALLLRPREYVIGIGCRRGKSADEIRNFISEKLNEMGLFAAQVYAVSSILQKRDEQGIIAWCQKERIPFLTYTAEELWEVEGEFQTSSFVREQVGVDNVCERAALRACEGGGRLAALKYAKDGMTIAVARREWRVCFYDK